MINNEIKNLDNALAIIQVLRDEKLKQQTTNLTELIVKN